MLLEVQQNIEVNIFKSSNQLSQDALLEFQMNRRKLGKAERNKNHCDPFQFGSLHQTFLFQTANLVTRVEKK